MKLKNILNEGRLQNKLEDLIRDLDKNGYSRFADDYDIDPDDANEMMDWIANIPDRDAKRIMKDFKKGMYEGKLNEASMMSANDILKKMTDDNFQAFLRGHTSKADRDTMISGTEWKKKIKGKFNKPVLSKWLTKFAGLESPIPIVNKIFESRLNESQKITDNDIEKMADIAKKHKMKLAKMATHKAVSGNWTYQKMYDELMDDHDGQSYVSNSDRKKFYKAVKKAFPKAKIKEGINEGLNKTDVKYAMKMAFGNIPGNWHKALKKVEVLSGGPKGGRIKINMSSYMGPNKTLQAIVDEFNDIMGMKGYGTGPKPFKINKGSFVKGSITSIILESNDLVFNHGKFGGTGKPWPQTEPNEFAYIDFKKWAKSKEKKIKKQMSILKDDRIFRAMEFVWQTWDKHENKGAFSNIKGNQFGRALVKMMWEDNLVFDKKNHKIITIKESSKLSKIIETSSVWKRFDKIQKLRGVAIDIEHEMMDITSDLKQTYIDMEQEAEPEGGKKANYYAKTIEKYEKLLKKKRADFNKRMKELEKLEQY